MAATAGDGSLARLTLVAAAFGAVVGAVILAVGPVSGAHINPAVTAGAAVRDRRVGVDFAAYLGAQLAGGLVAGALLRMIFAAGASSGNLGSTALGRGVGEAEGFALEVAGTFVLVFVALSVGRWTRSTPVQAATVGSVLFLLIMVLGPLTGASFNPARSLGPAIASGFLDNLGLFVVGPLLGGALAGQASRMAASPSP